MKANNENKKMQLLISSTLRIGVITACTIALVSGIYYLISHGMDPMPDYQSFHGETTSLTTLSGIFTGMLHMQAENWIQFGVIVLMLTPIFANCPFPFRFWYSARLALCRHHSHCTIRNCSQLYRWVLEND